MNTITITEHVLWRLAKPDCRHCFGTGRAGFYVSFPLPCRCVRKNTLYSRLLKRADQLLFESSANPKIKRLVEGG